MTAGELIAASLAVAAGSIVQAVSGVGAGFLMVPMLAWIAREAPGDLKATYFAVMAAFTNLTVSASNLATAYFNRLILIARGQYDELGMLMITVTVTSLSLPILTVFFCNRIFHLSERQHGYKIISFPHPKEED